MDKRLVTNLCLMMGVYLRGYNIVAWVMVGVCESIRSVNVSYVLNFFGMYQHALCMLKGWWGFLDMVVGSQNGMCIICLKKRLFITFFVNVDWW
jgi:hypothetical protein